MTFSDQRIKLILEPVHVLVWQGGTEFENDEGIG